MIPAEFAYSAPGTLEEALGQLSADPEAKALAGGHSLLPLMKLRLATPGTLVDLRRIDALSGIRRQNGGFVIGALSTHSDIEHAPELGLLSRVAGTIADRQVRNRGTIGGSLAHGDPASDLPGAMLACEADVVLAGPGGRRTLAAGELFRDYMETALGPDELITEIHLPALDGYGSAYQKFTRRSEDWAMVGVGALVRRDGENCVDVRVSLTNMGSTPLRAHAVEDALRGGPLSSEAIAAAAQHADAGTDPPPDLNATTDYKRHLARVLCRRALEEAAVAA